MILQQDTIMSNCERSDQRDGGVWSVDGNENVVTNQFGLFKYNSECCLHLEKHFVNYNESCCLYSLHMMKKNYELVTSIQRLSLINAKQIIGSSNSGKYLLR